MHKNHTKFYNYYVMDFCNLAMCQEIFKKHALLVLHRTRVSIRSYKCDGIIFIKFRTVELN
jgi:hypothetical protein